MRAPVFALLLILFAGILAGCDRLFSLLPGMNQQDVVLSDKPMMLGTKATTFSPDERLEVKGVTTDFCVTLSTDVPSSDNTDADYEKLLGGANLSAVLHAPDGKKYSWTCNGWSFFPDNSGRGRMDACFRWECNQTPPKGTEITSIDVTSDRPLRILAANWSSTDSFDFMSAPPPDRVAMSSAEYRELEAAFGGKPAWSSPAQPALQVMLESNRRRASSSKYNSSLSIRFSDVGIQLQPGPDAVGMDVVTIPAAAVEACSMTCFGNLVRDTELLLSGPGIKLGFLNKPEVIDWCWNHKIPMATSATSDAWFYQHAALPARDSYAKQFESRAAYDHQAHQTCIGY